MNLQGSFSADSHSEGDIGGRRVGGLPHGCPRNLLNVPEVNGFIPKLLFTIIAKPN